MILHFLGSSEATFDFGRVVWCPSVDLTNGPPLGDTPGPILRENLCPSPTYYFPTPLRQDRLPAVEGLPALSIFAQKIFRQEKTQSKSSRVIMTLVATEEGQKLPFNVARISHISTLIFSNQELSDSILLVVDDDLEESGAASLADVATNPAFGEVPIFLTFACTKSPVLGPTFANSLDFMNRVQFVSIPNNIVELYERCFYEYNSLKHITFGSSSSLKWIGRKALARSGIEHIHIPGSVEELGPQCFHYCKNLVHLRFSESSSLKRIGRKAFAGCHLVRFDCPDSVEEIYEKAFYRYHNWHSRDPVPTSVEYLTFGEPSSLKRIGAEAFAHCNVKYIKVPDSVEEFCPGCFASDCENMRFGISSSLKHMGKRALAGCKISAISIPDGVEELDNDCFQLCEYLSRVSFSESTNLKRINEQVFVGNRSLREIEIPSSVEEIGSECFSYSDNFEVITFREPAHLRIIGRDVFCTSPAGGTSPSGSLVREIRIPDSLEELGAGCFCKCENLVHVTFGESPSLKRIGVMCFARSGLQSFSIPESVTFIGGCAFGDCPMTEGMTCDPQGNFKIVGSLVITKDGKVCCSSFGRAKKVLVPKSVEELCDWCFYFASHQQIDFAFGSSLKRLGEDITEKWTLKQFKFPAGFRMRRLFGKAKGGIAKIGKGGGPTGFIGRRKIK